MEKLLLIDGHSILSRAYYALPDMTNSKGIHTNAIYGFLNIMMKYIDEENPDYLAVAFDLSAPTFRHEMFSEYKGTRKGMDDELRQQVPLIQEVLKAMNIPIKTLAGIEADDILGTLAKNAQKDGLLVTVISGDRDLLQLADKNIKISIPKTKAGSTITEEYFWDDVVEKMGVTPIEYIDVKALMGDKSDNIPGVYGIGEKGAVSIISKYKTIEAAIADVENVTPKKASANLKEYADMARLSKQLATIKLNCDITLDMEAAKLSNLYTKEAYEICKDLELKSFIKRFPKEVLSDSGTEQELDITEELRFTSSSDALNNMGEVPQAVAISIDDKEDEKGFVIVYDSIAIFIDNNEIRKELNHFLINYSGIIISFEIKDRLLKYVEDIDSINPERFFDVTIGKYLLDPIRSGYELSSLNTGIQREAFECYLEYKEISEKLKETKMEELFLNIEMPLLFTLAKMEREGIYLDKNSLKEYNEYLTENITKFENEIYAECGEIFNINSPKQLGVILFEKMGIPGGKKTKTGYSTAADVLEKLAFEYPVVNKILLYRQYTKLKSTYAEGLLDCVSHDNRVHTTFKQTVTATGRLSSINPNLQNIPIRTELGRMIRKVFIAKEGHVFIDADYSQIELRVLAHMSGDDNLIAAYRENKDIHKSTAAKVFGKKFEDVTDLERSNAKAVNFGIVYGISSFGLSSDLNISRKLAQQYIDDYYKAYPMLKTYLDNLVERAKTLGYAITMYGRRRPVPELKAKNFMQRSFGERVCMNTPIQGSAADIIKIAMLRVDKRLKEEKLKSKLILQVHDELLIEALESEKDKVKEILAYEMENAAELKVPLVVDIHEGKTWFDSK